jgi:hypothetical protein
LRLRLSFEVRDPNNDGQRAEVLRARNWASNHSFSGKDGDMGRFRMMLAAVALLAGLAVTGSAKAQGVVFGGGGVGYGGFYGTGGGFGRATPYGYGYNPYYGGYGPYSGGFYPNPSYGYYANPPMTVNTMGSLIQTIQRNTGRRRGGWQRSW